MKMTLPMWWTGGSISCTKVLAVMFIFLLVVITLNHKCIRKEAKDYQEQKETSLNLKRDVLKKEEGILFIVTVSAILSLCGSWKEVVYSDKKHHPMKTSVHENDSVFLWEEGVMKYHIMHYGCTNL